jgi:hypothetical protein
MWLASVAPLVKMSSLVLQPSAFAAVARAAPSTRLASCPGPCCDEALAQAVTNTGPMASSTSGAGGVVAL